jgi:hypothetical protein
MRIVCFDFETYLIAVSLQHPPAVCMSYCDLYFEGGRWLHTKATVVKWRDGIALLRQGLREGWCFVGASTAFDWMVSVFSDVDDAEELMALWVQACDVDRVTDVLLRQALADLSVGDMRHTYSLASVCAQLNTPTQPNKESPWRLRYSELDGVEICDYPADAYQYSAEDAEATAQCWIAQELLRAQGSPHFPGKDILADQYRQQRAALPLADISATGRRAHKPTVERFRAWATARREVLQARLVACGLVRVEYKRDLKAIAASGLVPLTTKGGPSLTRAIVSRHPDERIRALQDWPASQEFLHREGFATRRFIQCPDIAESFLFRAYAAQGRTPLIKIVETKDAVGKVIAKREVVRQDNDACTQSGDPLLVDYSDYKALTKLLGGDFKLLDKAANNSFHPHYRVIVNTGRTSSGAEDEDDEEGNDQNLPRKPGVRECYSARNAPEDPWLAAQALIRGEPYPGDVIFDADFSSLELHTFAQNCFWMLGWSKLGEMLNTFDPPLDGESKGSWHDVHLEIAAAIKRIAYDDARRIKKKLKDERTGGKGVNFGRKGGMGAKKLVAYFWNNYRVDLALDENKVNRGPDYALQRAQELIDLHDRMTPEFPAYSAKVQSYARDPHARKTVYDLEHLWSGRLVAGLFYADVHNYPFQGLGADLAKVALWLVFKARWGCSPLGKQDPLYRARIIQFTHDSITGEAPAAKAPAAAKRLGELMSDAARLCTPDCPTRAEPSLMSRLSKNAEPIYDATGELLVWDPWVHTWQVAQTCPTGKDLREYLIGAKLPPYCIDDIVERPYTLT